MSANAATTDAEMRAIVQAVEETLDDGQEWILIVARRLNDDGAAAVTYASSMAPPERRAVLRELVRQDTEGLSVPLDRFNARH
jgi:predicted hotdog family 3-hydroxylacyl-ACP dehydratase